MLTTTMVTSVVWFRKCLRVHDNPALVEACSASNYVIPVYILETGLSAGRTTFCIESLRDLDGQLKKLGSGLIVLRDDPVATMTKVLEGRIFGKIDKCFWEDDPVDPAVLTAAKNAHVQIRIVSGNTLWDVRATLAKLGKPPPTSMPQFMALVAKLPEVPAPLEVPKTIPGLPPGVRPTIIPGSNDEGNVVRGGETAGLVRLQTILARDGGDWAAKFQKPKTASTKLSTTLLSPYLAVGCISVRYLHHELKRTLTSKKKVTQPPESLLGQLYFREMAYLQAGAIGPNFHKQMKENPAVRYLIPWRHDPDALLHKWEHGMTGYPYIDACMRQLMTTGWMHHLGRHAVACFLTRGDLWISWEHGAAVFEKYLLDADWALNTFNWLGLSGVAPWSPPFFRVYNPCPDRKSALNIEDAATFIRRFVPELKDFPDNFLVTPWKAPILDQRKANCIIGKDYPKPIIGHPTVSKANIAAFQHAMRDASSVGGGGGGAVKKRRRG